MSEKTETAEAETKQLAVRLPVTLIERIERHAARLKRATPGVNVTRTDALRALLLDAVSYAEAEEQEKLAKAKQ